MCKEALKFALPIASAAIPIAGPIVARALGSGLLAGASKIAGPALGAISGATAKQPGQPTAISSELSQPFDIGPGQTTQGLLGRSSQSPLGSLGLLEAQPPEMEEILKRLGSFL